jgi:hypothetical protein
MSLIKINMKIIYNQKEIKRTHIILKNKILFKVLMEIQNKGF